MRNDFLSCEVISFVMAGLAASAKASARQHGKAAAKPWRSRDPAIHLF
jgi:hypothetical protein